MTSERIEEVWNYYQEGQQAFYADKELWQCPYVNTWDDIRALNAWMAGWMCERQRYENSK